MTVRQIARYPVKGLPAIDLAEVDLTAREQVPGDRRFAFWRGDDPPAGGRSPHQRRFNFRQVADDNTLAALRATSRAPAEISLQAPDGTGISSGNRSRAGRAQRMDRRLSRHRDADAAGVGRRPGLHRHRRQDPFPDQPQLGGGPVGACRPYT